MTLNEYQQAAMTTCTPSADNFAYMMLNLVGEVGELSSKVAKSIRKGNVTFNADNNLYDARSIDDIDPELDATMRAEAGDVLWQLAGLCHVMGWDLEQIAQENRAKLRDRQQRNVIVGDGDNR